MKITKVEPLIGLGTICGSWVFARVETDEGIVGYGEGTRHAGPVIAEAIKWLEPYVIGKNPFDVEKIYAEMYYKTYYVWGAVFSCAISAVESALWDIMGKALGKPVYELLGGRLWDEIRLYTHIGGGSQINLLGKEEGIEVADNFEEIAKRARDLLRRGFTCVKTFQWGRYAYHGRLELHDFLPNMQMDRAVIQNTSKKVEFIRSEVSDKMDIAIDVHGLNLESTVRLAKALEPYDLIWYEEPVQPFNLFALLQIRHQIKIPIAMSERLHTTQEFAELLHFRVADIIMPDVQWCGGVSQTKKIAAMAEANYIPVTLHNCNSPLATIINGHIASTMPNFLNMEFMDPDVPWRDEVITEPLRVKNGFLELNEKPGWGVDLNEEALKKHPYLRGGSTYEARSTNIPVVTDKYSGR